MTLLDQIQLEQDMAVYAGEDQILSAKDIQELCRQGSKPSRYLKSKIAGLDAVTDGFHSGQLIIVSGTTGQGKTTLCETFTKALIEQDMKSLWFSYEIGIEDFLSQFEEYYLPFFYLPKKLTGKTAEWLEQRIVEGKLKYGIQAVFIDHLHYLIDLAKYQNISFDIGTVVRSLKQLSIKHNIITFLICHTTKTKSDHELELGDVRDSSFIEQEADTVLYVWRIKQENQSVIKVAKNRKRGIIDKKIPLYYEGGRLYELQK